MIRIRAHDTAWLATVYARDFRGVVARGRRVDRPTLFQVFSRDAPDLRFTIDELEVHDFGTAATVMGRLRTLRGGELGGNHWWIVAAAGSAVPPDADRH